MELQPFGVGVSLIFPPNTDTEGFKEEQRDMPQEVREISDSAGLFPPKHVAKAYIQTLHNGDFTTSIGLEGWMLGILTAGAGPEPNPMRAVIQVLLAGFLRGVMLFYNFSFYRIVQRCHLERLLRIRNQ